VQFSAAVGLTAGEYRQHRKILTSDKSRAQCLPMNAAALVAQQPEVLKAYLTKSWL